MTQAAKDAKVVTKTVDEVTHAAAAAVAEGARTVDDTVASIPVGEAKPAVAAAVTKVSELAGAAEPVVAAEPIANLTELTEPVLTTGGSAADSLASALLTTGTTVLETSEAIALAGVASGTAAVGTTAIARQGATGATRSVSSASVVQPAVPSRLGRSDPLTLPRERGPAATLSPSSALPLFAPLPELAAGLSQRPDTSARATAVPDPRGLLAAFGSAPPAGVSPAFFFAGFVVLAALLSLAIPELGRRLALEPALVRPALFASPPERPG